MICGRWLLGACLAAGHWPPAARDNSGAAALPPRPGPAVRGVLDAWGVHGSMGRSWPLGACMATRGGQQGTFLAIFVASPLLEDRTGNNFRVFCSLSLSGFITSRRDRNTARAAPCAKQPFLHPAVTFPRPPCAKQAFLHPAVCFGEVPCAKQAFLHTGPLASRRPRGCQRPMLPRTASKQPKRDRPSHYSPKSLEIQ